MASKTLLLLGLFAFTFVVSEVAAASERQSGTVKSETEKTALPESDQYNGGNGGRGEYNGRGPYHGGGSYNGGHGGAGGLGFGPVFPIEDGCRHGCCYRGRGGCSKCCSFAGEAVQTQSRH